MVGIGLIEVLIIATAALLSRLPFAGLDGAGRDAKLWFADTLILGSAPSQRCKTDHLQWNVLGPEAGGDGCGLVC